MMGLIYITERRARELVESEVKVNDKGFIRNAEGFANHCISTGSIAENTAKELLRYSIMFKEQIDPDIARIAGYMHDLGKIYEGDIFHEIPTAEKILNEGENFGLVTGSRTERSEALKKIACLIPPDGILYEQLGGEGFPHQSPYRPEIVGKFIDRISDLRKRLSSTKKPLSMREFALPLNWMKKIAIFSDFANLSGEKVSIEDRIDECIERYSDPQGGYYDHHVATILEQGGGARMLQAAKAIEILIR